MKKMVVAALAAMMMVSGLSAGEKYSKKQSTKTKYNCAKNYCKYMTDCDEAYYKLKKCGMKALDGDRDGVPCESICSGG